MSVDIEKVKRKLLVKYPLFGSVVANTNFVENSEVLTAGTDGKTIYYNESFVSGLKDDEKTFIFAHEICHIAFDHIFRSKGKDPKIWNTATDAVINALLEKDGLKIIEGGVDIKEAANYDAEEMYKKLLNEKKDSDQMQSGGQSRQPNEAKEQNKDGNSNGQGGSSLENEQDDKNELDDNDENKDVGHDTHSMWSKAVEKRKEVKDEIKDEKQKNSNGNEQEQLNKNQNDQEHNQSGDKNKRSLFDKIFNKNGKDKQSVEDKEENKKQKESNTNKDDNLLYPERKDEEVKKQTIKRLTTFGEKSAFNQNKIERKRRIEELREALANQSHGAGIGTNKDRIKIDNIGISSPLIDWRKLLKEAVSYNVDWTYKNASIEDGVVTPYLEDIPTPETEILLDTSGSVSETLLRNFLRECKNILQNSRVKVGCFDDEFYGYTEIRNEYDIDSMEFKGGGGTNFDAAVNAFTRRVENKIIFTDGEASMPHKQVDAIWIVFGGRKINPPGGKVINIDDEALERLSLNYNKTR